MKHIEATKSQKRGWIALACYILFLFFFLCFVFSFAAHAQAGRGLTNTFNVSQFPGTDVGTKLTNAQNACLPDTALPCVLLIDPVLAVYPTGTLPTKCANCMWMDYRTAGSLSVSGLNSCQQNGDYIVGSSCYSTVQAAITAACAAGGGTVRIPAGTYSINSALTLCSHLEISGAGSNGPAATAGTSITSTMTSGNLFDINAMLDIHIHDLRVHNTSVGVTSGRCVSLHWGQGIVVERFWCDGNWDRGIALEPVAGGGGASTITNTFRDFQVIASGSTGVGCSLDALSSADKTINGNNFVNGICSGTSAGGKTLGGSGGGLTYINENRFTGVQFINSATGFLSNDQSTFDTVLESCTIEGNGVGISSVSNNLIVAIATEISANTTNISDANGNIVFLRGRGTQLGLQTFKVDSAGNFSISGLGLNGSTATANTINAGTGWQIQASGTGVAAVNNTGFNPLKPLNFTEGTAPTCGAGADWLWGDSTAHALKACYNNGSSFNVTQTVASGTASMTTAAIGAGACGTTVTVAATGVATTDVINVSRNAAVTAPNGELELNWWPTSGNVNFNYCNPTAGSLTPGAATLNWNVVR